MAVFDISAMNLVNPDEARSVNEMIFQKIREDRELNDLYAIVTGVQHARRIPIMGLLTDIMETYTGGDCSFPEGGEIPVTEKTWNPVRLAQEQKICKEDTESKFAFWQSQNPNLVEQYDLTGTGELDYLIYLVEDGVKKAIARVVDFADTSADLVSGGGKITTALGADGVARMNAIDGIWTQLIAIATANASQYVEIAENSLLTKAAQLNLGADTAKDTFEAMILGATEDVPNDAVIQCTSTLFRNYFKWLVDNSFDTSMAVENRDYRSVTLAQYGGTIIERKDWDRTIQKYFDDGTVYDLPHRAVLSSKENLMIGTPSSIALGSFDSFYSKDQMKNIVREMIEVDAKVALDGAVMVAY